MLTTVAASRNESTPSNRPPSCGGVVLFELLTGRTLRFLPVTAISGFAISPDGQELATVSDDRMLRIWRIEDGAELHCIQAHGVSAKGVAWTMDGRTLGTVGMDGLFRCWRRDVMQMTMEVPFSTQLLSLEFSPDGKKLQFWTARAVPSC
jgi:WD40 repeat protein